MVGLYHKRRAQRARARAQNRILRYVIKTISTIGVVGVVLMLIVMIFFTGARVKAPLASYLSAKSGLDVSIEDAEFSPLYPNIIKLYNLSFGNSLIGEFYLEYDLTSVLGSEELKITDIYINKLKLDPKDLEQIANSQFGYEKISAQAVRFHHTPLRTQFLRAKDATIRLNDVTFSQEDGLDFASGFVQTEEARLFDDSIKRFAVDFERTNTGLKLNDFSLGILGGTVTGNGYYIQGEREQSLNYNTTSADDMSEGYVAGDVDAVSSSAGLNPNSTPAIATKIDLDVLNLSKVIIQQQLPLDNAIDLTVDHVNLMDVMFLIDRNVTPVSDKQKQTQTPDATDSAASTTAAATTATTATAAKNESATNASSLPSGSEAYGAYTIQGINGQLRNLKLSASGFSADFEGKVGEFSLPNVQTTFENNQGKASLSSEKVAFDFKGLLYEGQYEAAGEIDFVGKSFDLESLKLNKNKTAINPPRLAFSEQVLGEYTIKLHDISFNGLEFLSYINALPVSIESISGEIHDIGYVPQTAAATAAASSAATAATAATVATEQQVFWYRLLQPLQGLDENKQGQIKLNLRNSLYTNLLFKNIEGDITLDEVGLSFNFPKLFFKESTMSATGELARGVEVGSSSLHLTANDFESADLNSNLISHMLTGKVDFDLELSATPDDLSYQALVEATEGKMQLQSDALLIADLGLDLINGGKKQNFELSGTELLTALQGAAAGINDLSLTTNIKAGKASTKGSLSLATSNLSLDVEATPQDTIATSDDAMNHSLSGALYLVSKPGDSATTVTVKGTMEAPRFAIHAQQRGEPRPGLYLPQYEATAMAKERTDAAAVLKGLVPAAPKPKPAPDTVGPEPKPEQDAQTEVAVPDSYTATSSATSGEASKPEAAETAETKDDQSAAGDDIKDSTGASAASDAVPANADDKAGGLIPPLADEAKDQSAATDTSNAEANVSENIDATESSENAESEPSEAAEAAKDTENAEGAEATDSKTATASDSEATDEAAAVNELENSAQSGTEANTAEDNSDSANGIEEQTSADTTGNTEAESSVTADEDTASTEATSSTGTGLEAHAEAAATTNVEDSHEQEQTELSKQQKREADETELILLQDVLVDSFLNQDSIVEEERPCEDDDEDCLLF